VQMCAGYTDAELKVLARAFSDAAQRQQHAAHALLDDRADDR
jgi:hypothetical protein